MESQWEGSEARLVAARSYCGRVLIEHLEVTEVAIEERLWVNEVHEWLCVLDGEEYRANSAHNLLASMKHALEIEFSYIIPCNWKDQIVFGELFLRIRRGPIPERPLEESVQVRLVIEDRSFSNTIWHDTRDDAIISLIEEHIGPEITNNQSKDIILNRTCSTCRHAIYPRNALVDDDEFWCDRDAPNGEADPYGFNALHFCGAWSERSRSS
jgi:hypothetical protein